MTRGHRQICSKPDENKITYSTWEIQIAHVNIQSSFFGGVGEVKTLQEGLVV